MSSQYPRREPSPLLYRMMASRTMSLSSDEVEVDDSWKVDLEIALLEDADFFRIRSICANRPVPSNSRREVWRICLKPELQVQAMTEFHDVFDLPNQPELHAACEKAATEVIHRLSSQSETHDDFQTPLSDEEDDDQQFDLGRELDSTSPSPVLSVSELTSNFESVLTHFARTYSLPYEAKGGWVRIIQLLYETLKPVDRHDLYACFAAVYHHFIPTGPDVERNLSCIFRILLQYHEPKLCSFLDSLKLKPEEYATSWLLSLFATAPLRDEVLLSFWDIYFLLADPLFGLFVCLVLLMNLKSSLLDESEHNEDTSGDQGVVTKLTASRTPDRDCVLASVLGVPKPMQVDDLGLLVELTQLFSQRTPYSFRSRYLPLLFSNTPADVESKDELVQGTLCMPVSVQEVLEAQAALKNPVMACESNQLPPAIRYLLVDCRPADQYNAGHLNTAFFLDSELMLSEPSQFASTVQALLQSQKRALDAGSHAAGEHITFLSSGREAEDNVANVVVAAFLRMNTPYVSLIEGGYSAVHESLGPNELLRNLVNHDPRQCLCCKTQQPTKKDNGLMDRIVSNAKFVAGQNVIPTVDKAGKSVEGLFSKLSIFKSSQPSVKDANQSANSPDKMIQRFGVPSADLNIPPNSERKNSCHKVGIGSNPLRSLSYRNTSSVFSIDEEADEEEVSKEHPPEQLDTVPVNESHTTRKGSLWSKNWSVRSTTTLSRGDSPLRPGGLDSSEPGDLIDTTQWSSRPEVRGVFECQLIDSSGRLSSEGCLVLAERHMLVLRNQTTRSTAQLVSSIGSAIQSVLTRSTESPPFQSTKRPRHAVVLRSVPLGLITRITANKRLPECITFHYSGIDSADLLRLNEQTLGARDRLFIPKAGEAVRMIKLAIVNVAMSSSATDEA
ncbi:hypothetical protein CRM22_009747 [Opisthorchis felineus]|uniref:TBC1 domain family member 23 n=1 Tax=Opisthorchis felineus TaxID=147828 RepID=A0A4S2L799_OPIFE|nr:hypothetical protein CRM22_009747 [Opisthorchis felineus]